MREYFDILYKKLNFLDEKEKEEVILKYKKLVDENNTKEEVIKKIGTIDSVLNEICKEHNLNYEYCSNDNNLDKNITNISNEITEFIKSLIKVYKCKTYSNNIEIFIQLIVKILIYILFISLIKLPFIVIEHVIKEFNYYLFYPYSSTFNTTLKVILSIIYFLICIISLIKVFGNYKKIGFKTISKKEKEKIEESVDENYKYLDIIVKVAIYLIILIPLLILTIIFFILFICSIFLVVSGIKLLGLVLLFASLFLIGTNIFIVIKDSLNHKSRSYFVPILISVVMFMFGLSITLVNLSNFKTSSDIKNSVSKMITDTIEYEKKEEIKDIYVSEGEYEIVVDDSLKDEEIKIEVSYYDDYVDVHYGVSNGILILKTVKDEKLNYEKLFENVYKDLKNGYIINYANSHKMNVKVYMNENSKKSIELKEEEKKEEDK